MALLVEMGWGGLVQLPSTITWTDISQYVNVAQGVAITRGASDELSETQPGTATLVLENQDGRFTPGNAASPYYPFVRRNAPIRIAVALIPTRSGSAPYPLAQLGDDFDDNRISTMLWPNSYGGVSEVGGRARVPVIPAGFAAFQSARQYTLAGSQFNVRFATLPAAGGSSAAGVSVMANSTTDGTRIGFTYNPVAGTLRCVSETSYFDGSATTLTFSPIDHMWLRIRESGGTFYWETSGDGYVWTVRRTLATPAWVTSQQVLVEMVANRTGGVQDYVEFDLAGATIKPRFYGVVNEFPVDWEGLVSTVRISCTDLFKRLNKLPALRCMLSEEIVASSPGAYYPLTEAAASTSAGDVAGGAAPSLAIAQVASGGTLEMGAATGPAATSESAPVFTPVSATAGKYLRATLPDSYADAVTTGYYVVEAWFQTTTTGRAIVGIYSQDLICQVVLSVAASGGLIVEYTTSGSALATEVISGPTTLADGKWHHVVYDQRATSVWIDGVLVDSTVSILPSIGLRELSVGGYQSTRLWSGSIGHVAVYAVTTAIGADLATHYAAGMTGYEGETADQRITRLVRYAGLTSVTISGSTHDPVASQGTAGTGVVARMREVESTESGKLFAARDGYRMVYQSRDVRYNPSPAGEAFQVDYADLETRQVELADDDQKLVNDVTAARAGGATQRVTAPASIQAFGPYPQTLEILKISDNSVLDAAYWLVSRYANPAPELREVPIEAYTMAAYTAILDTDISSYFSVNNLPSQAPTASMRVTVEGYTETIRERSHLIQFHTSASATDSVWVLDDPAYSVLDSTTRLAY